MQGVSAAILGIAASLPALLVALAQAGVAATGGPSLDQARVAAGLGRIEEALKESSACFDLGIDAESAGRFHDQIQLVPRLAWATNLLGP